jgi:hypothetical protein
MLTSWSFELNSNKSFGTPDSSIPVPSHGHSARQNPRFAKAFATGTAAPAPHKSHSSHQSHNSYLRSHLSFETLGSSVISWSLVPSREAARLFYCSNFGPWTFSSFPTLGNPMNHVNSVKTPAIHVCNLLISRVCTVLHVNKNFFCASSTLRNRVIKTMLRHQTSHFHQTSPCPLCPLLCVLCVTLSEKLNPQPLTQSQNL